MGTDIHGYIERKISERWELCCEVDLYRDYDAFAILGDVRNGEGFGGCDTGDAFDPMTSCRELPPDIGLWFNKEEYDEEYERRVYLGDHSFGYVTLDEILRYDWDRTNKKRGYVGAGDFYRWRVDNQWSKVNNQPHSYCGDVGGGGIVKLSNDELQEKIDLKAALLQNEKRGMDYIVGKLNELHPEHYTKVEWEVTYAFAGEQILKSLLPQMTKYLRGDTNTTDIRFVFGFDS